VRCPCLLHSHPTSGPTLPLSVLQARAHLPRNPGFSAAKDYGHLVQAASSFLRDIGKGVISAGWMPHGRRA